MYNEEQTKLINSYGWHIVRDDPIEITDQKGSYASRKAAQIIIDSILEKYSLAEKESKSAHKEENVIYVVTSLFNEFSENAGVALCHSGTYGKIGTFYKAFRTEEEGRRLLGDNATYTKLEIHE